MREARKHYQEEVERLAFKLAYEVQDIAFTECDEFVLDIAMELEQALIDLDVERVRHG